MEQRRSRRRGAGWSASRRRLTSALPAALTVALVCAVGQGCGGDQQNSFATTVAATVPPLAAVPAKTPTTAATTTTAVATTVIESVSTVTSAAPPPPSGAAASNLPIDYQAVADRWLDAAAGGDLATAAALEVPGRDHSPYTFAIQTLVGSNRFTPASCLTNEDSPQWVSCSYLQADPAPILQLLETPAGWRVSHIDTTNVMDASVGEFCVTDTTPLNMRSGPGTEFTGFDAVPVGECVDGFDTILMSTEGRPWRVVEYRGMYGWVSDVFLAPKRVPQASQADCVASYALGNGMDGPDAEVALLQARLTDLGLDAGEIDGYFGPQTWSAAVEYLNRFYSGSFVDLGLLLDSQTLVQPAFDYLEISC